MTPEIEVLLAALRGKGQPSDPTAEVADLIDASQPEELRALLETLARHPHGGAGVIGRYAIRGDCVQSMVDLADELPAYAEAFLPGFSSARAVSIGMSDDSESTLFAAWNPGDATAAVIEWVHGGFANDGPSLKGKDLIGGLRSVTADYVSSQSDADWDDEETLLEYCDEKPELVRLLLTS